MTHSLPRNQNLPLFNPHVATFTCEVEASKVPPIDAQAEAWFLEARALESPEIYVTDRDYKKIVQLTRQAAERRHWKAMLNLASFYVEGRDPPHGVEDAVKLVEEGMRLGIPAAYDRMGTYYMNGTGVPSDATRAYAFWQKAAEMGNPQAMTFFGDKLRAGKDGALPGYWANIPIAIKMLECALGQGYGPAAENLHFLYAVPRAQDGMVVGDRTRETKARAIKVLHEGVKFGCSNCARDLWLEFYDPDLANMLVPYLDKARGERYQVLSDALDFNPDRRFPNLDKVLPLPPAKLPPWNGERTTLLKAAMGVTAPPPQPPPTAASGSSGRHFLGAAFNLRPSGEKSEEQHAPRAGYWQPTQYRKRHHIYELLTLAPPGLYQTGEAFERFTCPPGQANSARPGVMWEHWEIIRHNHIAVAPQASEGLTRIVPSPQALSVCAKAACPVTGVWQPWIHAEHPLRAIVNQPWRQVWLTAGQAFPRPEQDWLLALPINDVTWHLMDQSGVDIS